MLVKKETNSQGRISNTNPSSRISNTNPSSRISTSNILNPRNPKKRLLYPFILYCCNYTIDDFWRNVFEDLAYGKSPFGTYIYKNTIISTSKGKEFTFVITDAKTPEENYNNIYSLFQKKLGIISIKEKLISNGEFSQIKKYEEWSNIRKKNIRDILLEQFILSKKEEYNLTMETCKKFMSIICFALLCKTIASKHIEMSDGKIYSIKGVKFFNKNVRDEEEGNSEDDIDKSSFSEDDNEDDIEEFGTIIYDYDILENYKYVNESKSIVSKKNIFNNWNLFIDKYYGDKKTSD